MEHQNARLFYSTESGNGIGNEESEDDLKLKRLLRSFELEEIYNDLKTAKISFKHLKYLNRDDIKEAIKPVGLRAEFRQKLFSYLKSDNTVDDETLSNNSKVIAWLGREQLADPPSFPKTLSFLNSQTLSLTSLLQSSARGNGLLTHYEENSCLTKQQRDELIEIILEEVVTLKGIKLRPESFAKIVQEIVTIFPNEKQNQEYYFIPRQHKKNPSGKLYSKYFNMKTKRKKWDISIQSSSCVEEPESKKSRESELAESISLSLKKMLKKDCTNWKDTINMWHRTFTLRQADAEQYSKTDFLLEWPIFNDARAPSLIHIDFKLMHPGKEQLLKSKWDSFKKKVFNYYITNIRNPHSKNLLIQAKETKNIDCENYIFAVLLNSILLPSTRFKNLDGNRKKRASIEDANERFVLIISTISDYKIKVDELLDKYCQSELPIQPFIIAEGSDPDSIKAFYVYFDKTLYKFDNFIESLDVCFKIFQIFNLKYPQACELPWNFIQRFFYEIHRSFDLKSPNLTSLFNYMQELN